MSSQALALAPDAAEKNIYESLALRGDMSALSPQDKTAYLQKLCESLGLNPLTQPFIPLKLNGKEILYASRGATDQLASIHKLTREIIKTERIEDVFVSVCKVSSPDGRFDISTGAVTIGNLKGDALCNAMMKSETKAKRRATLSFCGLGFLDETEIETIPANSVERIPPPSKTQLIDAARTADAERAEAQSEQLPAVVATRNEIELLLASVGINPVKSLERFDGLKTGADKANALRETRKHVIKTIIASDDWGYSEDGTAEFLKKFGIEAIDTAADEKLADFISELKDLGLIEKPAF